MAKSKLSHLNPETIKWTIYVIKCPFMSDVRYVGWTSWPIDDRLREHIRESKRDNKTRKQRWIVSILNKGSVPLIEAVDSGVGSSWAIREQQWIAYFKSTGARLVNGTIGGDGIIGWGTPEERSVAAKKGVAATTFEQRSERSKRAAASRTPAQRKESARKRLLTLDRVRLGNLVKEAIARRSQEDRRKSALFRVSKMTPEQNAEKERKRQLTLGPEGRSAAARKREAGMTLEQKIARAKKRLAATTAEQRSDIARAREARMGPERRTRRAIKREIGKRISRSARSGQIPLFG